MLISLRRCGGTGRADNERSTVSQGGFCLGRHASASIDRLRLLEMEEGPSGSAIRSPIR
jgi:hypothetical protein